MAERGPDQETEEQLLARIAALQSDRNATWTLGSRGFVKLYGDRLAASSLLLLPSATFKVFVWMLSQADAEGRYRCQSTALLAGEAHVAKAEADMAVAQLEAPDTDENGVVISTSKVLEGRRIVRIPGGWLVVNRRWYRDLRTPKQIRNAAYQAKHKAKVKAAAAAAATAAAKVGRKKRGPQRERVVAAIRAEAEKMAKHMSGGAVPRKGPAIVVARGKVRVRPSGPPVTHPYEVIAVASKIASHGADYFTKPEGAGLSEEWLAETLRVMKKQLPWKRLFEEE